MPAPWGQQSLKFGPILDGLLSLLADGLVSLRLAVSPLAQAGAWGLPELTAPGFWGSWAVHDKSCSDDRWRRGEERCRGSRGGLHTAARVLPVLPATRKALFGPLWVFLSLAPFSVLSGSRDEEREVLLFFKFKMTFKITSLVPSAHVINGETEA